VDQPHCGLGQVPLVVLAPQFTGDVHVPSRLPQKQPEMQPSWVRVSQALGVPTHVPVVIQWHPPEAPQTLASLMVSQAGTVPVQAWTIPRVVHVQAGSLSQVAFVRVLQALWMP
jgi:hypothetical protein